MLLQDVNETLLMLIKEKEDEGAKLTKEERGETLAGTSEPC